MSLEDYIRSPWAKTHGAYEKCFMHMRPAPEYASGEVLLASTYRYVGFSKDLVTEGKVPALGREFQKNIEKGKKGKNTQQDSIDPDTCKRIVTGTLRSPKQPNH